VAPGDEDVGVQLVEYIYKQCLPSSAGGIIKLLRLADEYDTPACLVACAKALQGGDMNSLSQEVRFATRHRNEME
jgi:hypothetical protein